MGNYFETQWLMFITQFLLLPAFALAIFAQAKIKTTFTKYSKVDNKRGLTGAEVARRLLAEHNITDVQVLQTAGQLTDHYDPTNKVVRLSTPVYNSKSLSALSVAAHEVGHAIQHNKGYFPLHIRNSVFPITSFASMAAIPLMIIGLYFSSTQGFLFQIGVFLFMFILFFQIVTLPVEFNASKRAIQNLKQFNLLNDEEIDPAKQVLSAAALTYVASAISSMLQLVRLLVVANARNND